MPRRAFSLVELLVVITIIVVLLALLTPALSKAVYAAKLAACAANQRLVAGSAIQYAFEQKRFYPDRPKAAADRGGLSPWAVFLTASGQHPAYDMRPLLREKLQVTPNVVLQDPLLDPIDFDAVQGDELAYGANAMWFGWRYQMGGAPTVGMDRLGDRFEFRQGSRTRAYSLLVSDIDLDRTYGNQTSHPDIETRRMFNEVVIRTRGITPTLLFTASYWRDPSRKRGLIDHNYAYDDSSVRTVKGLKIRDERMDLLANTHNNQDNLDRVQVPSQ